MRHRRVGVALAAVAMIVAALACGQTSSSGNGASTACADLFTNFFARCALVGYPAGEISRLQGRWATYCGSLTSLPGFSASSADLETCAQAYATVDCNSDSPPPGCAALNTGTLAASAACVNGSQCQSGSCNTSLPDGGTVPSCGTCDTLVPIGGSCGVANTTCGPNAGCSGGPNGGGATCVANADAGATMFMTVGAGAPCNGSTQSFCGGGLLCGPKNTCITPTFVAAGQSCDYQQNVCLVGSCNGAMASQTADGGLVYTPGTCPAVISDGQPCDSTSGSMTCDTLATCIDGTCQLAVSGSLCK